MPNCKCTGATCGCAVTAGDGVQVEGTGTAANPFVISIDPSSFNLGNSIRTASSATIELSQVGTGATNDPLVLTADQVLKSPDGTRWAPTISNSGVVTYGPAGPVRSGAGSSSGTVITVVSNDILYYDPITGWDARSSTLAKAIYSSIGNTGVPVPPGFKKGDTWLVAAT